MEQKKSSKADLEGKRGTFFLLGLVVALGSTLAAFELKSHPTKIESLGELQDVEVVEQIIPPTLEKRVTPPPPPPPKIIEFFEIVDNDVEVSELEFEDSEATEFTSIDFPAIVSSYPVEEEEEIYVNVIDEPAEFPGGERSLYKYISDHVKYPLIAQENGIQGKVYVKFVVDENGYASNVQVLRPVDSSLDAEAIQVIAGLPRFKPGIQGGRAVKVYYTAVINFQLQ